MKKILITALLCSSSFGIGLRLGDSFKSTRLHGAVGIECNNGMNMASKIFRCQKEQLLPAMEDYVTSQTYEVDKVVVTNITHPRKVSKTVKFKVGETQSLKSINLWKNNLWNKALLKEGQNTLVFKAYLKGKLVTEKTQNVNVDNWGDSNCGSAQIKSKDMADCYSMARACDILYRLSNYCQ